jgi:hypothetical protein
MTDFSNIKFEAEDGIYFSANINEVEMEFFLDISLLEDLTRKKSISNRGVALTLFHSLRSSIYTMCINAVKKNPNWASDKSLPLLKEYLR